MQFGNMMSFLPTNCKNVLNSTSTNYYLHELKNVNLINYSQEFDYTDLREYDLPNIIESLNTFLLYNSSNNEKLMMNSFRRQNYMNSFIRYIGENSYKYNA